MKNLKHKLLIFDWEGTLMMPDHQLFPQIKEVLLQLKAHYLLAIATNRGRRSLERLILETHLQNIFLTSRCADETAFKPDPLMLQEILLELDIPAHQAIMIGDSESDMIMAQKVNMERIVACYQSQPAYWQKYQPLLCFNHIQQLSDYLLA